MTGAAFVYAAQGTQWPGMGRALLAIDAAFRDVVVRCDAAIRRRAGWSLCDHLREARALDDPRVIQPALTALQLALTGALAARGVRPVAVGSLSMGEAAAAHAAGMLSLDDAIAVACSTARLAETELRPGLMAFVRTTPAEAEALIAGVADRVAIAVELGRRLTVISGEQCAVREVMASAASRGVACGALPLAQAYHSPDVAALRDGFVERLASLAPRTPRIDSYSSATGGVHREVTPAHWWQICSARSRFHDVALAMVRAGHDRFIEIGPHPMLAQTIEEAAAELGATVRIEAAMRRDGDALERAEPPRCRAG